MKITIHQPDFLPWFGFFYRWKHSDLLIIYDDAQYIKHGWQNRDKLLINEREQWLTVPVVTKGKLGQLVSNVMINNTTNWKHKHINTFKTCFGRTPSFSTVFPKIQDVYAKDYDKLIDFNLALLILCADFLQINTPFKLSSDYGFTSHKTEKLIKLLHAENANAYLTGIGSRNYIDENLFKDNHINLIYQDQNEISDEIKCDSCLNYSIIQYLFNHL